MRTRAGMTIDAGGRRSGSWSEGIFGGEPADVDEMASGATRTAPRFDGSCGALVSDFEKARCRGFDDRRGFAFEVEEKAGLSGATAFGRVPKAEVADLMQACGQDVLEKTADELMARHAAGAPAR